MVLENSKAVVQSVNAQIEVIPHNRSEGESLQAKLCERVSMESLVGLNIKKTPILLELDSSDTVAPRCIKRYSGMNDYFILSLYSRTAAKIPVAHLVLALLTQQIRISKAIHDTMVTVLHEAVLNAVIHGNCDLESNYNDKEGFLAFQEILDKRLADAAYGLKRVVIEVGFSLNHVVFCVTDEGEGNITPGTGKLGKDTPHGRGLDIIFHHCEGVSFSPEGNTIIMEINGGNELFTSMPRVSNDNADQQRNELRESLKASSILLVDDLDFNLMVLSQILESNGFTNFHTARNGREALEKISTARPDLVVLDLMMPEMDGFEFCQHVRGNPELKDLPIVVQTALTVPEQRLSAFQAGASDFIGKPVDPDEMIARLLVHLERQKLFKDLTLSRRRMAKELDDAREMQQMILPSSVQMEEFGAAFGIKIDSYFQPSSELGGDFWGVKQLSEKELAVYIVDFSGHGVTAALNTFRLHTLMHEYLNRNYDPGTFLSDMNTSLNKLLAPGQFATMFYGIIDVKGDTLSYAAAASPSPILVAANGNIQMIDGTGFPLGINGKANYKTMTMSFKPGDVLCLYSDALIETEDHDNSLLKEEEVCQLIASQLPKSNNGNSGHFVATLLNRFANHIPQLKDDLTVNFYHRKVV